MPRQSQHPTEESFNFRIDPQVKAAFQITTEAEDKPAPQVWRDFMRAEVMRWIDDVADTDGWTA